MNINNMRKSRNFSLTIIVIRYDINGKLAMAIFKNHKRLERVFYKFYELEIFLGTDAESQHVLTTS